MGKLEVVTRDSKVAVKLIGEDGKVRSPRPSILLTLARARACACPHPLRGNISTTTSSSDEESRVGCQLAIHPSIHALIFLLVLLVLLLVQIFAVAPVRKDGPPAVEKVSDSSRYFVLR